MNRIIRNAARVAAALALGTAAAGAQSIASRVSSAGQGEVRMTYATRPDVCGDGNEMFGVGDNFMMNSTSTFEGRWTNTNCRHGAARVSLQIGPSGIVAIRTRIGGSWSASSGHVIDLGVVSAPAAAAYFLDLAEQGSDADARSVLMPAIVADSADIAPRLLAIGRRASLPTEMRRNAIRWAGMLGDASMVAPLTELAKSGDDGKKSIAEAAVFALSRLPGNVGTPSLIDLAHNGGSERIRSQAVFWLGQSSDERGRREVRAIAGDANTPAGVREKAVFALGHSDATTADDLRFLRDLFGRVNSDGIRNQILMSMAQSDDSEARKWVMSVARDENEPVEARKKAIFWAGQGDIATTEIAAFYDAASNEEVKEHAIFVLSQRNDQAATDKLLAIVHGHDGTELRKKALFWLGQKNDPAVTKAITDLVTGP
ncbi:MAG: HEAT repeat domain-containing protein [Gemmatimonadaceae bacterium]